ncbi:MAG: MaoC family dehydratase [Candidatus Hydrogenedentota bacterium]
MTPTARSEAINICPPIRVTANNYALHSDNKMHDDSTAAEYGFRGGLVPGVGVYAYMTQQAVRAFGREWIERGAMRGKFLKPVYHGETVTVHAEQLATDALKLSVVNSEGTVCAVGEASLPTHTAPPESSHFAEAALPQYERRRPPDLEHLPKGETLGTLPFSVELPGLRGESGGLFYEDVCDPLEWYRGPEAVCHPAWIGALANRVLAANIELGPWIHTETHAQHFASPLNGEETQVRARIHDSFEKKGHVFVVADVLWLGRGGRSLARAVHTAIVRPAHVHAGA